MGALEGGLIALAVLFFILRALYRGVRWMFLEAKRTLGLNPARPVPTPVMLAPEVRQTAQPPTPAPPQPRPAAPAPAPVSAPREERPPQATPREKIILRPDGNDLVRALIWQEILAPPVSKRTPKTPSSEI